ncbi:hypothetical protein CGMCC3_g14945 [Colletotrichum fructicola]|nr:uncharacterized protein CGMCC3_g14945 [Colletotrichum fructicola]KAE9568891.1 hypothetical protein CGMCC3_g14945 [Colletotrichum fructicola]
MAGLLQTLSMPKLSLTTEFTNEKPISGGSYQRFTIVIERKDYPHRSNSSGVSSNMIQETGMVIQREERSDLKHQIISLANSNYAIDAMVIAEDSQQQGNKRLVYKPAKIKFDTGSDVDLVSRRYLPCAGLPMHELIPIPVDHQAVVHGVNNAKFTSEFEIMLAWSRLGDARTNNGRFLVVDEAPFDLLLSPRWLLDELRLSSLPLFRPRKDTSVVEQERNEERKHIEAAKTLEEEEYQREMAKRDSAQKRLDTTNSLKNDPRHDEIE